VEGCFAPRLSTFSIHNGGVEVYVKDNAKVKYITIQNWSSKIINIGNKRGITYKNANLHWIEGSLSGYHSFSYPSE